MTTRRGFIGSITALAGMLSLDTEKILWRPNAKTIFIPNVVPTEQEFLWITKFTPELDDKLSVGYAGARETLDRAMSHQMCAVITEKVLPIGTLLWKSIDGYSVYPEPRLDCERFGRVASPRCVPWIAVPVGNSGFERKLVASI